MKLILYKEQVHLAWRWVWIFAIWVVTLRGVRLRVGLANILSQPKIRSWHLLLPALLGPVQ